MGIFIIEGIKCSGKSTLSRKLKEVLRPCTIIEFRSYYSNLVNYEINDNNLFRLKELNAFASSLKDSNAIFVRNYLFPFSYTYGKNNLLISKYNTLSKFLELDSSYQKINANLICLNVNKVEFQKRQNQRIINGREEKDIHQNWKKTSLMQNNLKFLFKNSKLNKISLDTSNMTPIELLKKIEIHFKL